MLSLVSTSCRVIMNTTLGNDSVSGANFKRYYVGYANALVCVFGFLGNILVILCIYRKGLWKNNYYYLVLHLAICDLLNLLGAVQDTYGEFMGRFWSTSPAICKLSYFHGIFFTAGVYFMVLISLSRYRAVFYPLRPAIPRWKLHLAAAVLYVVSVLFVSPVFVVLTSSPDGGCLEMWPSATWNVVYTLFLSSVYFFVPALFLGVVYWKICCELIRQGEKIKSMTDRLISSEAERSMWWFQKIALHRNARTFLICFIIFVCFLVCGTPQQIMFFFSVCGAVDFGTYYIWLTIMYYFGVTAINPFIYGALDKKLFNFKQRKRT